MRTREKGYEDYGLTPDVVEQLKTMCARRNDPEIFKAVYDAAYESNPAIADELAYSLRRGVSVNRFDVPYADTDFYGYRRLALAIFKRIVEERKIT